MMVLVLISQKILAGVSIGRGMLEIRVCQLPLQKAYVVYNDYGIPPDSEIWTWDGSRWGLQPAAFDGSFYDENAPEGNLCFMTRSGSGTNNYAGWGVFLSKPSAHTIDLTDYKFLKLWIKVSADACINLKVQLQQDGPNGKRSNALCVNLYGWTAADTWQEITIPKDDFVNVDFTRIFSPFMITIEGGGLIFYVDNVVWV